MSARDVFHDAVRRGLEKDQWQISSDPLELRWEEVRVKIDWLFRIQGGQGILSYIYGFRHHGFPPRYLAASSPRNGRTM
jgi:hypothetical protein